MVKETEEFFKELGLKKEDIAQQLYQSSISSVHWQAIQKEIDELDAKHKRERDNLPNPEGVKKKQKERNIPPNWIFVK